MKTDDRDVRIAQLEAELRQLRTEVTAGSARESSLAEVLRLIASSPTDLHRVITTVAETAQRLCGAYSGFVLEATDGGLATLGGSGPARFLEADETWRARPDQRLIPFDRSSVSARAFLDRRTVLVDDIHTAMDEFADTAAGARALGFRSVVSTPLLQGNVPIGVISLYSPDPRAFGTREMRILETFADQAVIAIENARLFQELQERTAQLTRSVEEQRALAEVSQAVSSSLDLQAVLTTIVSHAVHLSGADSGSIFELDDTRAELVSRASFQEPEELLAWMQHNHPRLDGEAATARAARTGTAVQVPDLSEILDAEQTPAQQILHRAGLRSFLAVPLVR